ncbi:MAG: N-6 DNA methylase [Caldiserica bacterium]|jgi:predicted helicase|nr:N-6 DNA methylase [Caldisericota bacterium]
MERGHYREGKELLKQYLEQLTQIFNRGDAREESYYSILEGLLKEYADFTGKKNIQVTTLPKKTEAGNPDFRVWDGKQHIVGYIEAKAPTVDDLNQIAESAQLKRYRDTFPNLILTNFIEFRLYRNGDLDERVQIARPFILHRLQMRPPVENEAGLFKLLEKFFSYSFPEIHDAKTLAMELAKRTRFLRDEIIKQELEEESSPEKESISAFYEAFKKYLISGLTKEEFADLYSQTITYGLFAARTRSENSFNRKLAYDSIPHTIGILKDLFKFISLGNLPQQMEWIIDDIAEVLAVTDVFKILDQYFREHKGKDPIVHFYETFLAQYDPQTYETFLAQYDPQTREKRGVYYTPEPVVLYIVRSLHHILREHFRKSDGFASSGVTVLDPAAGTLTFLAEAAKLAVEEFTTKYGEGGRKEFIKDYILKNFYAFELMVAPYTIGHLKMSFLLEELGYKLHEDDRFHLYLTNTLEMEELDQTKVPGIASLSEESHLAGKIKKEQPILVILGNPPYSGHSANINPWIDKLLKEDVDGLQSYYKVDGKPLGEKNPKWLQDDYVKFIRFAQWKINQAGEGVLGFITNHSYLDNPTFRGMRQSLMNSFNEIYILDLHGNSLKKEKCPDGSKDENVFDIQQGVAIALFIKRKGEHKECQVYHSEIWGLREEKYNFLLTNDIKTTKWEMLSPKSEFYLFIPREESLLSAYQKFLKITDVFPVGSVGIVTARDKLTIAWTPEKMWLTVMNFSRLDTEIAREVYQLGKDVRDWKVELAKKDLKESGLDKRKIVPILYRPFDIRYTYYTGKSRGFHCMPRPEVMRHMMQENLGLITARQMDKSGIQPVFATNSIIDAHSITSAVSISNLFPLYLYPDSDKDHLFNQEKPPEEREPNINPGLFARLIEVYGKEPTPEEILYYLYAVLYSNIYRVRYAEFLKTDFPRVPFTQDYGLFSKMAEFGKRLVELHLLKSEELDPPLAKFQGQGDGKVGKLKYLDAKVYINDDQYFEGITPEVWEYQIGGYQVCDKWLKDRKGQRLGLDEIKRYCQIVTALSKTIEIQKEVDALYPEVEEEVIEF